MRLQSMNALVAVEYTTSVPSRSWDSGLVVSIIVWFFSNDYDIIAYLVQIIVFLLYEGVLP